MTYIEGNIPSYLHRQMIPRLLDKIAAAGMSPVPGLAFTEYDCGCEGQIAGGIAQADMLGLFGRWGVYAATAWLNARNLSSDYAGVAFDLYRNYDGAGATVGELAVSASTSDEPGSALYAFAHAGDASKLELVALNRRATSLAVHVAVATAATFGSLARYHLVAASPVAVTGLSGPAPVVSCSGGSCGFDVTLEPSSATVLVLR
jgi:mannan endo-1,4-beta-mannosidase